MSEKITIRFEQSIIVANIVYDDGTSKFLKNGSEVSEKQKLTFMINPFIPKLATNWFVNDVDVGTFDNRVFTYTVKINDAVLQNDEMIINISCKTRQSKKVIIDYDDSVIDFCRIWYNTEKINSYIYSGTEVYEGDVLEIACKNNFGKVVESFLIAGKELKSIDDQFARLEYCVDIKDAVIKDGKKHININCKTRDAQKATIAFDPKLVQVSSKQYDGSLSNLSNGDKVDELSNLIVYANYKYSELVDFWMVNDKKIKADCTGPLEYKLNLKDTVEIDGKLVANISFKTRPAEKITVNFDPKKIECQCESVEHTWNIKKPSTEVYEGDTLNLLPIYYSDDDVITWNINNTTHKMKTIDFFRYNINTQDAIEVNGKKVININYTRQANPLPKIKILFDEELITCVFSKPACSYDDREPIRYECKSGKVVPLDLELYFVAIPTKGKVIDAWYINDIERKEYSECSFASSVFPHLIQLQDAVDKNGEKIIEVSYTTRDAEKMRIIFPFNVVCQRSSKGSIVKNGSEVYENEEITFSAKDKEGLFYINGKCSMYGVPSYIINELDAIEQAGEKVLNITFKEHAYGIINFDEKKLLVKCMGEYISSGSKVYIYNVFFNFEAILQPGEKVEHWYIADKKVEEVQQENSFFCFIEPKDLIKKDGENIFKIDYTKAPATAIQILFDSKLIIATIDTGSEHDERPINNGDTIYEQVNLSFYSNRKGKKIVNAWTVNGVRQEKFQGSDEFNYKVDIADTKLIDGKNILEIGFELVDA